MIGGLGADATAAQPAAIFNHAAPAIVYEISIEFEKVFILLASSSRPRGSGGARNVHTPNPVFTFRSNFRRLPIAPVQARERA